MKATMDLALSVPPEQAMERLSAAANGEPALALSADPEPAAGGAAAWRFTLRRTRAYTYRISPSLHGTITAAPGGCRAVLSARRSGLIWLAVLGLLAVVPFAGLLSGLVGWAVGADVSSVARLSMVIAAAIVVPIAVLSLFVMRSQGDHEGEKMLRLVVRALQVDAPASAKPA
jgi:hypothetical protein